MKFAKTTLCSIFCSLLLLVSTAFAQMPAAPVITSIVNVAANTITVTISEADPAYEIHYTTDGSAPTATSALYVAPVVLTKSGTVKAIAVVIPATAISSADFTIVVPVTSFPFALSASPATLSFSWQLGAASSIAQSLTVQDSSPCPPQTGVPMCHWLVTVTTDVPWLTATPGTTGFVSSVALNTTKLTAAGTFSGNVILTAPQFKTPTIKIPVTVVVTPAAVPVAHNVKLTWAASTSSSIAGYNVLRSAISGGPYALLAYVPSGLLYLDAVVLAGTTYFYVVTAVNAAGAESVNSTEVAAAIPTP